MSWVVFCCDKEKSSFLSSKDGEGDKLTMPFDFLLRL